MTRDYPRCGARKRQQPPGQTDARCGLAAGWGTPNAGVPGTACRKHLGGTRNHRAHAASLHAERSAARALETLRTGPIVPDAQVDPLRALKGMLHESAILTAYLRGQVEALPSWIGDKMGHTNQGDLYEVSEEERALVKLYNEAIDRTAKLAKCCLDAGVDAAIVRLNEEQGARLNAAFRVYMERMGFNPETVARSRREFAAALMEIAPRAGNPS